MFDYIELNNTEGFKYLLNSAGQDILINNVSARALITNTNVNQNNDIRKITTLDKIERGFLIDYDGYKWLVVSEVNGQRYNKFKGLIQRSNYNVKFNFDGNVKEFPCIIDGQVFDVQSGQYIMLPTGKILVTMQENNNTLAITINQRFIKMGSPWKITGIDRTKRGLITLSCDIDQFAPDDDKENEIANVVSYTLAFSDISPIEINIGDTYQTNIVMQKNGTSTTFPVFYSSDNGNVSVDANGLLTANIEGSSVITVAKADNPSVFATLDVTAKINHIPVVENRIDPQTTEMLQDETVNYSVYQYVDSVANTDTFKITASGVTTDYYTLTIVDGNHFNVYNKQFTVTPLVITCTNNRDGSSTSISINLKGLW